jgi:hypothetical protein
VRKITAVQWQYLTEDGFTATINGLPYLLVWAARHGNRLERVEITGKGN